MSDHRCRQCGQQVEPVDVPDFLFPGGQLAPELCDACLAAYDRATQAAKRKAWVDHQCKRAGLPAPDHTALHTTLARWDGAGGMWVCGGIGTGKTTQGHAWLTSIIEEAAQHDTDTARFRALPMCRYTTERALLASCKPQRGTEEPVSPEWWGGVSVLVLDDCASVRRVTEYDVEVWARMIEIRSRRRLPTLFLSHRMPKQATGDMYAGITGKRIAALCRKRCAILKGGEHE